MAARTLARIVANPQRQAVILIGGAKRFAVFRHAVRIDRGRSILYDYCDMMPSVVDDIGHGGETVALAARVQELEANLVRRSSATEGVAGRKTFIENSAPLLHRRITVDPRFEGEVIQIGIEGIADIHIASGTIQDKGLPDFASRKGNAADNGPIMAADNIVGVAIAAPPVGYPRRGRDALSMCNGISTSEPNEG